ncbi:MAG TPA: YraN family protein [Candidatus Aquicultor sp.]|jgi:putative endonuclease
MALGKQGEDFAALHLQRKDYRIIERNFRTKLGEIDIIAATGRILVFCEVKTRLTTRYGQPFEAVTPHKQRTIRAVAEMYLAMQKRISGYSEIRFDVISILQEGREVTVNHIENAF